MKRCSICSMVKDFDEFYRSYGRKDGRQSMCKPCHKEYEKNRKREYRNYIQLLRSAPCACCGNQYHYLMMDFHHLDRSKKEIAVSDAISRGWSLSRIKKEIDKCIIMCKRCHTEVHHGTK